MKTNTKQISLQVTEDKMKQLDEEAKKLNMTRNGMIKYILFSNLNQNGGVK